MEMSLEERRKFLNNYGKLVKMFGQELVDEGLLRYGLMYDLVEYKDFPLQDANGRSLNPSKPHGHSIYIGRLSTPHRFVNRQGWEKTVTVPVERYLVPYTWQGNDQAKHIVRPAMLKLYPWLEEFYFHVYQLCFFKDKQEEFYVTLSEEYGGHKSLYVPFHDFMVGDTEAICKRNESYLSWYTRDGVVWEKMRKDPVVLHFLKSTEGNKK